MLSWNDRYKRAFALKKLELNSSEHTFFMSNRFADRSSSKPSKMPAYITFTASFLHQMRRQFQKVGGIIILPSKIPYFGQIQGSITCMLHWGKENSIVFCSIIKTICKAAVHHFFLLKMIRNQYLSKYITRQCSKLSPYFSLIHNA